MNEKVSYLLPEDYPAPCGILREHFPDFAAVSRFRGGWGYGADDAVSIIMPEAAPEPGKDAAEEFSFEERLKGISLQNAFIVMRTREELFFSRPEGERFVNQACRKRGQAFCLVKGVPHDLIRIDVTAYPETAWAGIKADWEARRLQGRLRRARKDPQTPGAAKNHLSDRMFLQYLQFPLSHR